MLYSSDQIELMADIFPGISKDRIKRALHRCQGNIDECVQVLLDGTERNHLYQEIPEPVQVISNAHVCYIITLRWQPIGRNEHHTSPGL